MAVADRLTIPDSAFSLVLTAGPETIDELGHVNNAVWVQWIQHVAVSHWQARADAADQDTWIWVVVRHEIDYHRPLTEGQQVTAYTWVPEMARGATFDRLMQFIGPDGKPCVSARTTWALLDRASGRPARVPKNLIDCFLVNADA